MTRKILYSPGWGAGWTTWEPDPRVKALMLTYAPIVEALERGDKVTEQHPAVQQLLADVAAIGANAPYLGGLRDLTFREVSGPVRITEHDGNESIKTPADLNWM